jgi:hypothetical protein
MKSVELDTDISCTDCLCALGMEAVYSCETFVNFYKTTRSKIPEDSTLRNFIFNIIALLNVFRDGFSIGNWICWIFTLVSTNNSYSLSELHTQNFIVTTAHIKFSQSQPLLGSDFNGGRCPSSGFPNCPRPHLPATLFSQVQRLNSKSKSKLLYDWRFTVNQFVLAPSH